jgi:hypothetical protein
MHETEVKWVSEREITMGALQTEKKERKKINESCVLIHSRLVFQINNSLDYAH